MTTDNQLLLHSYLSKNPSLIFLLRASQADLSHQDFTLLHKHLLNDNVSNPDTLIKFAGLHGVIPPLYDTLKTLIASGNIDETHPLFPPLKEAYLRMARMNMHMSAELLRINTLLKSAGIDLIAFKGPALAQRYYGDITQRQYSDLDLLVPAASFETAARLLQSDGYEKALEMTPEQEAFWYKSAKDIVLFHPEKQIHLELHRDFFDRDYPVQFSSESAWNARTDVFINNRPLPTFESEPLLIYLCIHGTKHLWERIGWIRDIDRIVRSQTLNWDTLNGVLANRPESGMVALGFYLAQQLFNTPLPESVTQSVSTQPHIKSVAISVIQGWQKPQSSLQQTRILLLLLPSLSLKWRYLTKVIFKPSSVEYAMVNLPKRLYWLYYLLRPFQLLRKYLLPH